MKKEPKAFVMYFNPSKRILTADCSFATPIMLEQVVEGFESNSRLALRPGLIEVDDTNAPLHTHNGLTVAYIISGTGIFKTEYEDFKVYAGCILVIEPGALHASQANAGEKLVEFSIFYGNPENFDAEL